jgi:hypothetical protein
MLKKAFSFCSRVTQRLNVPQGSLGHFVRCGRADGLFDHPAASTCYLSIGTNTTARIVLERLFNSGFNSRTRRG